MATSRKDVLTYSLLIVPSVIILGYYFISWRGNYITGGVKQNLPQLPIFYPKEETKTVNGNVITDTIYHHIPEFSFTDQDGNTFTRSKLEGKIYIANYFFTTCKSICIDMSQQLNRVQSRFKGHHDFLIVSHTVDPENDSPEVLKEYAKRVYAEEHVWKFLTGDKKALYNHARKGYFIAADEEGDGGEHDFIHSNLFVLVDKEGRIRGYYNGTELETVSQMMDDIKLLLAEYRDK